MTKPKETMSIKEKAKKLATELGIEDAADREYFIMGYAAGYLHGEIAQVQKELERSYPNKAKK